MLPLLTSAERYPSVEELAQREFSWLVGEEREVDQGVYATFMFEGEGWRVWKFETAAGIRCVAAKSTRAGVPQPLPVGVGLDRSATPFIAYWADAEGRSSIEVATRHFGKADVQFRRPGDRFWANFGAGAMADFHDGDRVEINAVSWERPEINFGSFEETATLDLTGLRNAQDEVLRCIGR